MQKNGRDNMEVKHCDKCNGTGLARINEKKYGNRVITSDGIENCKQCNGTGHIITKQDDQSLIH